MRKKGRTKKLSSTLRLPTSSSKEIFISDLRDNTKKVMRIIAGSEEPIEDKERLADFFLFMLNILDIENEKLSFESIRQRKPQRTRKTVSKK